MITEPTFDGRSVWELWAARREQRARFDFPPQREMTDEDADRIADESTAAWREFKRLTMQMTEWRRR